MTKAELEKDRDEWKQQAESLQEDLDALNEAYSELEDKNFELSNNNSLGIADLDNLEFRMKLEGLWTDKFASFTYSRCRFYQESQNSSN